MSGLSWVAQMVSAINPAKKKAVTIRHISEHKMVAVLEVLLQSYAVSNLIRENKVFQIDSYLDTASNDGSGMQSLDACLFRLVKQGDITVDEALKFANQPESLKSLAAQLPED